MLVPIKHIRPNPHRDFELYPIQEDQVAKLLSSMEDQGQWATLPARPAPDGDGYEIAAGHHRIEAAKRLGLDVIELSVADRDDDQMLRIMIQENSTQRGHNAASTLDSVAAAMARITYLALTLDNPRNLGLWQSEKSFEISRGKVESGQGVGVESILAFLPPNTLTETEVREAVAILKSSDRHLAIIERVKEQIDREVKERERRAREAEAAAARLRAEREAAEERARKEAEEHERRLEKLKREQAEAKAKRDRELEERRAAEAAAAEKAREEWRKAEEEKKRQREKTLAEMQATSDRLAKQAAADREARERAAKAVNGTRVKMEAKPVLFDARCAKFFDNDSQVQVFRKAVTSGVMAEALPYERQIELAQAYCDHIDKLTEISRRNGGPPVRKSETNIREFLADNVSKFLGAATKAERDAKAKALRESAEMRIRAARDDILRGIATAASGFARLKAELAKWPKDAAPPVGDLVVRLREFADQIKAAISALR